MEQQLKPLEVDISSDKEIQLNNIDDISDINYTMQLKINNKKEEQKKFKITLLIIILVIIFIIAIIYFVIIYIIKKSECELGENEKCKTCDKNNYCDSCNPGYKLEKGKCILNYSFIASYQTSFPNQSVQLFGDFKVVIKEMTIDGEKADFCTTYKFKSAGSHTVIVLLDISQIKTSKLMFAQSEITSIIFSEKFNTESITDMNGMFRYCNKLTSIKLSSFNTKNVVDMGFMFSDCNSLKSLDLSNFNTNNVQMMNHFFNATYELTSLDISNFNTKNVLTMKAMFKECRSLKFINVTHFDTSKVTEMMDMFTNCHKIISLDLSNFNT